MADAYIFVGPTLPHNRISEEMRIAVVSEAIRLPNGKIIRLMPPVSEGDVLELVERRPSVIGIIDGYFENLPSVWHKEILYAMARGTHVLGAASMGALRAAELSAFGMEGIGKIYEDYAARNIEDDDEVAVAHGPAELGFPAVSDAMVNIRATLNAAVRAQAVTAEESALLVRIAKGMFYKDRTYNNLLATAFRQGMSKDKLSSLDAWFRTNRIDQKQIDAVLLLQTVLQWLNRQVAPKQVLYHFEETVLWRSARRSIFHEESNAS